LSDAASELLILLSAPSLLFIDVTRSAILRASNFALFLINIAFLNCSFFGTCGSSSSPLYPSPLEALVAEVAALELLILEAELLASKLESVVAIFGRK
jgi:hypothetical protein